MTEYGKCLVFSNGDLVSLAALAILDRPEQSAVWYPTGGGGLAARRVSVVRQQAEWYGIGEVVCFDQSAVDSVVGSHPVVGADEGDDAASIVGYRVMALMLLAAEFALARTYDRIIWPVQFGRDFDRVAHVYECRTLLNHLIAMESGDGDRTVSLDVPFLDLTDDEIVDLVVQADGPIGSVWFCEHDGDEACGGCDSCLRWKQAFEKRGLVGAWEAVVKATVCEM